VFSPDDRDRYKGLMGGLYDSDWFLVAADFEAYARPSVTSMRWLDEAAWRKRPFTTLPMSAGSLRTARSANMRAISGA
jgi:glucan phosphorylase